MQTVFLLDRVQKGLPLDKADVDKLRAAKLVEGRISSLFLSASASKSINDSASYIKNKGFDDMLFKTRRQSIFTATNPGNNSSYILSY